MCLHSLHNSISLADRLGNISNCIANFLKLSLQHIISISLLAFGKLPRHIINMSLSAVHMVDIDRIHYIAILLSQFSIHCSSSFSSQFVSLLFIYQSNKL
ncbi:hypothetical protein V6Z11_D09G242000 [Gossypium hirsutum]